MSKIFITGGTGFLGSYVLRKLVKRGHAVRALKRSDSRMDLVSDVADKVEWVEGDILDVPSLEDGMKDIDFVYHTAAVVGFSPKDYARMMKANIEGTANVVNVAMYRGVKKLGYSSSVAALGRLPDSKLVTETTKWENSSINTQYAISKYLAEQEVWRGTIEGLPAVMVNPTIIVGAGFWDETSVKFFRQMDNGMKFYTEGETGFVDVRDVAELLIRLVESDIENEKFITNSENIAYKDFMSMVATSIGKQPPAIKATPWMRELVWRVEVIRSLLTGSKPLITKETAKVAAHKYAYVNDKAVTTFDYSFRPIRQSIEETARLYQEAKKTGTNFGVFPLD
jgi:dihydroflavonol-4-reductase